MWSLRFFELDVPKQKLKWYRCKPGGKKGDKRGEINLARATASLKPPKQSKHNQKGHLISLIYTPNNSSTVTEMTLLSSSLDEAYQWIAHANKSGSFYDVPCAGVTEEEDCSKSDSKRINVDAVGVSFAGIEEDKAEEAVYDSYTLYESTVSGISQEQKAVDISCSTAVGSNVPDNSNFSFILAALDNSWRDVMDVLYFLLPIYPLFVPNEYRTLTFVILFYIVLFFVQP